MVDGSAKRKTSLSWLARTHFILVGILVLTVVVGASFADSKWRVMREESFWSPVFVHEEDRNSVDPKLGLVCEPIQFARSSYSQSIKSQCPVPLPHLKFEKSSKSYWLRDHGAFSKVKIFNPLPYVSRKCAIWKPHDAQSVIDDFPPALIQTQGLVSPGDCPKLVEKILKHPGFTLGLVLLVWSHSIGAAESWCVVHVPRLAFYLVLLIYRASILYYALNVFSKLQIIQAYMVPLDLKLRNQSAEGPASLFDYSDHIVYTTTLLFILITELYCAWYFRRIRTPHLLDTPLTLPRVYHTGLTALVIFISVLLLYSAFITAAYYHSPLESIVGLFLGISATFGVFWIGLALEYPHATYFGI